MSESDPHIHVDEKLHADAAVRDLMAATFGLVGDLPRVVTTGCGLRVPYAMTSARPESVTCLACREHANRRHLWMADQVERLGRLPGAEAFGAEPAARAAQWHRDMARRFADPDR